MIKTLLSNHPQVYSPNKAMKNPSPAKIAKEDLN